MVEPILIHIVADKQNSQVLQFKLREPWNQPQLTDLGTPKDLSAMQLEGGDALRMGEATTPDVERLGEALTRWVPQELIEKLRTTIRAACSVEPKEVVNVIFCDGNILDTDATGQAIAELPFELLIPLLERQQLGIDEQVAVSHYPGHMDDGDRTVSHLSRKTDRLRVLIVHSSPRGYEVPINPLDLRNDILTAAAIPGYDVQVDVLSRAYSTPRPGTPGEVETTELPTRENLQVVLRNAAKKQQPYHVLLYLGHAGMEPEIQNALRSYRLILENEGGKNSSLYLPGLSELVEMGTVPVVLLLGCFTAESSPYQRPSDRGKSNQGLAQALIHSSRTNPHIRFVVGMRSVIDTGEARLFTLRFFESLFVPELGGHLQAAASHARRALIGSDRNRCSWIAPVFFRVFPSDSFLELQLVSAEVFKLEGARKGLCTTLLDVLASDNDIHAEVLRDAIKGINDRLYKAVSTGHITLWPSYNEVEAGEDVEITVTLKANPGLESLEAELSVDNNGVKIVGVSKAETNYKDEFEITDDLPPAGAASAILKIKGNADRHVPVGLLFVVRLAVTRNPINQIATMYIDIRDTKPFRPSFPASNILVIKPGPFGDD